MKTQTENKNQIRLLEKECHEVSEKLLITDQSLKYTNSIMKDSINEKDVFIEEQNEKITHLGRDFDRMLNVRLFRIY